MPFHINLFKLKTESSPGHPLHLSGSFNFFINRGVRMARIVKPVLKNVVCKVAKKTSKDKKEFNCSQGY